MAITINWGTKVITIPKSFMAQVQVNPFEVRELDLDALRLALKDLEDSDQGMAFPDTHSHNTQVVLSGVTYARMLIFINDYTVTFEDGQYAVNAVGANSNIADVMNLNQVSLRTANSAGLITVTSGSGLSQEEHDELMGIETNIRGADADTLKTLSDQIDALELGGGLTGEEHDKLMDIPSETLSPTQDAKLMGLPDTTLTPTENAKLMLIPIETLTPTQDSKLMAIPSQTLTTEEHAQVMMISEVDTIVALLRAFVVNEKYLQKQGADWYLIIKDEAGVADILKKALKDKDGSAITDLEAGIMAQELASSV